MQGLMHVGNFKKQSRVFSGGEAKVFINGEEVGKCPRFDYSLPPGAIPVHIDEVEAGM